MIYDLRFMNLPVGRQVKKGFTMVELIFGIAFIVLMAIAIFNFQKSIFSSGDFIQESFLAEDDARSVLRNIIGEIRSMNYSGLGGYPISLATANSFVFYSDINGDGKTERLNYFLDGTDFKRGVVYSSGSPLSYDLDTEKVSILVGGVTAGSNIFSFYDTNYNGTGSALVDPIDIISVRLVKLNIPIVLKRDSLSVPYNISSQVSIRNLKDNL